MPLLVQCNGCGTTAVIDCPCPGRGVNGHYDPACQVADLDAAVVCPPDSDCCKLDHHHGHAANACPGIPDPDHVCAVENPDCTVCRPVTVVMLPGSVQATGG
jgi:hypothetical protein